MLFGSDANGVLDGFDEYFSVAWFARLGMSNNRRNNLVLQVVRHDYANHSFGRQMTQGLLPPKGHTALRAIATPPNFTHGHPGNAEISDRSLHIFGPMRAYIRSNSTHVHLVWAVNSYPMPYVITEACIGVKDKSCMNVCPVDCIYEGEDMVYIHPDECIDCGLCEPECPVTAIFVDTDVPPNLTSYIEKNKEMAEKLRG